MKKVLISVIIPIYNAQSRLEQCVKSIMSQTYTNLEICLIDDGSTDKSGTICDQLADEDSRIKAFHKKNGGVSTARNIGLKEATGDYIVFVDADDYMVSEGIEKMLQAVTMEDCDIAIAGKNIDFYGNQLLRQPLKKSKILKNKQECANELLYLNKTSNFDILWNKIYSADFIKKNALYFDEGVTESEDLLFNIDFFLCKPKVSLIQDTYYCYYKGVEETIVSRYDPDMYEVMKMRAGRLAELFQFYELDTIQEVIQWQKQAYLESIFNATVNIFRKGSTMRYIERYRFIKNLYCDIKLQESIQQTFITGERRVVKMFAVLYKYRMTITLEGGLHFLYNINQIVKKYKYGRIRNVQSR